jgi:hypothetical protein
MKPARPASTVIAPAQPQRPTPLYLVNPATPAEKLPHGGRFSPRIEDQDRDV